MFLKWTTLKSSLAALALTMVSGAAAAQEIEIATALGPVIVPASPEKIAVFDVAALDTLDALGVDIDGTVSKLYVDYLGSVEQNAKRLGTFWEPDFEATHVLHPDLIIVGSRSSKQLRSMAKIAPSVDMTIWEDLVPSALARVETYGKLFGREDRAAEITRAFNVKLEEVKSRASTQGEALVVMTNGPKISAYGLGGRFGFLHSDMGLQPASETIDISTHGEAISFEFIREADPEWLVVIDRVAAIGAEGQSAKATLDNPLVHDTTAWRKGQIIYLNAADIYIAGGGIQSLNRTMDILLDAFGGA